MSGIQKIPGSEEPGIGGAPEGIRTPNLLIRSQMLYPLSYWRMSFSTIRRLLGTQVPDKSQTREPAHTRRRTAGPSGGPAVTGVDVAEPAGPGAGSGTRRSRSPPGRPSIARARAPEALADGGSRVRGSPCGRQRVVSRSWWPRFPRAGIRPAHSSLCSSSSDPAPRRRRRRSPPATRRMRAATPIPMDAPVLAREWWP